MKAHLTLEGPDGSFGFPLKNYPLLPTGSIIHLRPFKDKTGFADIIEHIEVSNYHLCSKFGLVIFGHEETHIDDFWHKWRDNFIPAKQLDNWLWPETIDFFPNE